MKILVVTGGYLPGFRYGGPVRSLAAIVEHLGDEFSFSIVTANHDLGVQTPFPDVESDTWMDVGKAKVFYTADQRQSLRFWRKIIADRRPDLIYLNSFFHPSTRALLFWIRIGMLPRLPLLLAPRGEFSEGALALKAPKKRAYMALVRRFSAVRQVAWHVSSPAEAQDLKRVFPDTKRIFVAPNLMLSRGESPREREKLPGEARLVFVARISPKKNLLGALNYLRSQSGQVIFDVYGPVEDESYWNRCLAAASQLPPNVRFNFRGELPHSEVTRALGRYHFLLFPTHGENFGHSIAEALSQGLPVLISDQTPWRNLKESGVGWDIPLDQSRNWSEAIEYCISMDGNEYREMSLKSQHHVDQWMADHGGVEANRSMFSLAGASETA